MSICIPNHTAEDWTYSALQYWELNFFRFVSALKLVYFSDLLVFNETRNSYFLCSHCPQEK